MHRNSIYHYRFRSIVFALIANILVSPDADCHKANKSSGVDENACNEVEGLEGVKQCTVAYVDGNKLCVRIGKRN
jgi:hypothetical protein